jgi:hypothetical protein
MYTIRPKHTSEVYYDGVNSVTRDLPVHSLNVDREGVFGEDMYLGTGDFSTIIASGHWGVNISSREDLSYLDLNYDGIISLKDLILIIGENYWEFPNN